MIGSELLSILGERVIAFPPVLVKVTGSINAALFLSQALYWTRIQNGKEFYKTREEWAAETGMSRSEQETARKALVSLGILQESLRGVPATLHYKVNLEKLSELLQTSWRETCQPVGGKPTNLMAGNLPTISENTQENTQENIPPNPPKGEKAEARPSSVDAVRDFMYEAGYCNDASEAEPFWNHFQSNGWKIGGRAPMKDWRAAVHNWMHRKGAKKV